MKKQNRISKLSDQDEEYFKAVALKDRKQAVNGQPDSDDVYNLQKLFEIYDRTTGGKLKRFCNQLAAERALNKRDEQFIHDRGLKGEYLSFALPQELQTFMEKYYPTIWTNPEHSRWFIKRFPMFRK